MRRVLAMLTVLIGASVPAHNGLAQAPHDSSFVHLLIPPELIVQNREVIGLTEEQMHEITSHVQSASAEMSELHITLQQATRRMSEILNGDTVNEQTALAQLDEFLDAERAMKQVQLKIMIRVRGVLSAEQRAQLTRINAERIRKGSSQSNNLMDQLQRRLRKKIELIQKEFQRRSEFGTPPMQAAQRMEEFSATMESGQPHEAEKILDEVMDMLGITPEAEADSQSDENRASKDVPPRELAAIPIMPVQSPTELQRNISALSRVDVAWRKNDWETCLLRGIERSRDENKPIMLWVFIDRPVDDERC